MSAFNNANIDSIGLLGRLQLIDIKANNISFMRKLPQIAIFGMQWDLQVQTVQLVKDLANNFLATLVPGWLKIHVTYGLLMQCDCELHRSGRQDLDASGHQLTRLVGVIDDSELAVVALVGRSGDVQTLTEVKEDLGVPVGTLDEAIGVLDVLYGALFATLVGDFEGLV